MTDIHEPLMAIWFGNFYRPAFDDRAFIDASADISLRKLLPAFCRGTVLRSSGKEVPEA